MCMRVPALRGATLRMAIDAKREVPKMKNLGQVFTAHVHASLVI
jgi:hypothetical protein